MSATTQPLSPVNQTSSFIETSTYCDNFTFRNLSVEGQDLKRNNESFRELWADFDKYKDIYWGIVLFITVMGTIGNIIVFIMMGHKKLSSLSYSVYLKFLAVFDSWLLITTLIYETEKIYFLGKLAELKLSICILSFCLRVLSPWLVVGLTVDRYVCVWFPLTRERFCTRVKAIVICSVLLILSIALILPFPFHTEVVRGQCFPSQKVQHYYIFIRLLLSSSLPCLVILVLNIFIVIQIKRSLKFRNTFTGSRSNSSSRQQDSSTRPLVLVSLLAFVTMIPVALSDAVIVSIRVLDINVKDLAVYGNMWIVCFVLYLLNFGQNFYILIGSSSNYRQILQKRLCCSTFECNQGNRRNQAMMNNVSANISGLESGTTGLSLASIM